MASLNTCQITGRADKSGWSQIRLVNANDSSKLIILVSGRSVADGEKIISQINTEYHRLADSLPLEKVKKAVQAAGEKHSLEIAMAAFKAGRIWLAAANGGQINLYRQRLFTLAKSDKSKITAVSGIIQPKDRFILATSHFQKQIPPNALAACLKIDSLSQINQIISPMVRSKKKQGNLAVAIIDFAAPAVPSTNKTAAPSSFRLKNRLAKINSFAKNVSIRRPKIKSISLKKDFPLDKKPPARSKQNKAMTLTAIAFLLLFSLSLFISWQKKHKKDREKSLQLITSTAEEKLNTALSIRGMDMAKGLELAKEAKKQSLEGLKIDPDNETLKKIVSQSEKIISFSGGKKIMPAMFFDFKIIANNVAADQLYLDNGYLWAIDRKGNRLIKIDIKNKKTRLAATGEDVGRQKSLLVSGQSIFLLSDKGVAKLKNNQLDLLIKKDWQEPQAQAFWGGNIYVVRENGILKYAQKNGSFSKAIPWLKKETAIPWKTITSMDIDGKIWLMDNQGRIFVFSQGKTVPFSSPTINGRTNFLTVAKAADKLALWENEKKIIFVLNKSGKLLAKIPLKIEKINGLRITDKGDKIFLLSEDKIYAINI